MTVRPTATIVAMLTTLALVTPVAALAAPTVGSDCLGAAPEAQPGTDAWDERDRANQLCAQERHLDTAGHPGWPEPFTEAGADGYRTPSRHDGSRFRHSIVTIAGQEAEVYLPCSASTCPDLADGLQSFEPPYPAVVTYHGGASRKELHWWSSQALAEAGYMVVASDSSGLSHTRAEADAVIDWLHAPADELRRQFDGETLGVAGHSAGGVMVSRLGHEDARVDAIVSWDRAQSSVQPTDVDLHTPSLFFFADYNCQRVPICQPEPYEDAPDDPNGPGDKGRDFELLRDAGVDTMQIAVRAATHLDWVPSELSGNRYVESLTTYYTLSWFDRYLRGADDVAVAEDAFGRLVATTFDESADVHVISQGVYDPRDATINEPERGNTPYTVAGLPIADRYSFYFRSRCSLTTPDGEDHAASDDLRTTPCDLVAAASPDATTSTAASPPAMVVAAGTGGVLAATGAGGGVFPALAIALGALLARRRS